jgi:hypothetical protein
MNFGMIKIFHSSTSKILQQLIGGMIQISCCINLHDCFSSYSASIHEVMMYHCAYAQEILLCVSP